MEMVELWSAEARSSIPSFSCPQHVHDTSFNEADTTVKHKCSHASLKSFDDFGHRQ